MLIPSVPVDLLKRASEIACRRDIRVLLNEEVEADFELIFAAVKRMYALTAALRCAGLERWISSPTASGYSEYVAIGFTIDDLQRSALESPQH